MGLSHVQRTSLALSTLTELIWGKELTRVLHAPSQGHRKCFEGMGAPVAARERTHRG